MPEDNEYLRLFKKAHGEAWMDAMTHGWVAPPGMSRTELVQKYALAVPSQEALDVIARHSPLIEIGAGGGYWAYLLKKQGAEILPFDIEPPHKCNNSYRGNQPMEWVLILQGGPEQLKKFKDRTLFLCWPPHGDNMALKCLKAYKGDVFLYIGEPEGGATANPAFHKLLEKKFHCEHVVGLPQWQGVWDRLSVWRRK